MGASDRRKARREAKRAREQTAPVVVSEAPVTEQNHASSPPVLRLVRWQDDGIPSESTATGRSGAAVDRISDHDRVDGTGGEEKSAPDVVASAGPIEDHIPINLVRRSFDASEINPILNGESMFRMVGTPQSGYLDLTPVLADKRNILLMADNGGILFAFRDSRRTDGEINYDACSYMVHTILQKPERGSHGLAGAHNQNVCRAAYRWMFTQTDCMTLHTQIPAFNRAASIFAPLLGWVKEFERKSVWPTDDGLVDMSYWTLRYEDWIRKTPELERSGILFHQNLETEFERHGRPGEQHADETCHDRAVGAAFETIFGGQPDKAIYLYNRWARLADYAEIALVSHRPVVIDIGNAVLQVTGDKFKVVLVR
jgi:hypothetical protein